MAFVLNPSKQFADNIRLTKMPFKKAFPGNTREAFSIAKVHENGIFEVEDTASVKMYDRCYIFSDINYTNQDADGKNSILLNLIKWLNFMSTDFKITVANEYKDMKEYVEHVFSDLNKDNYPEVAEGMRKWIDEKMKDADLHDLDKILYLTITVRTYSLEEARSYFMGMDVELTHLFQTFKSVILPLHATERLNTIRKFFYKDEDATEYNFKVGDPVNDVIPVDIEAGYKDYLIFNSKLYTSVLFARSVSSSLDEEKVIHRLTSVSYPSFCTIDYAPVEKNQLDNKLTDANINNERSISQEIDNKRKNGQLMAGVSYNKQKKKDEIEGYIDQVDENNETCYLVGLLVVVTADSEDQLANRIQSMRHLGKEVGITLETYNNVQLKAFNTALPIGARLVRKMRAFLSSSLVSLQPFYAQDLVENGGYFFGINRTTKHLVFANRKNLKSPHGMIVGHTGSGKSYFMKETEVAQTLLSTNDDLQIIDPQNEMQGICTMYGGLFLDFTPKSDIHINPMEIPIEIFKEHDQTRKDQFVADITEWANSFCSSIMLNIVFTQEHRSFIGRAVKKIYERAFKQHRLSFQPTLPDLRNEIKNLEDEADNKADANMLHRIYNSLEEYTEGIYDMFAYPSNVDINERRFVVFGLANVAEDLWEPVMLTIMSFLSNRMEYNQKLQKATRLLLDEAQVVTTNDSSADMLLKAVITYRKFGGIVTMALQNLTRALENPDLRDMFSNCGFKVFFDQGGVDAQKLSEVQVLSEREFNSLAEETPGYGVMIWGKKVILLDSSMSKENTLYSTFSTNFHEKAADEHKAENKDTNTDREDVKEEEKKDSGYSESAANVRKLADVIPVTAQDVATAMQLNVMEADLLLKTMCQKGDLVADTSLDTVTYKVGE